MGRRATICAVLVTLAAAAPACTQILGFDEDYQVGGAGSPGIPCAVAADCPGPEDECNARTCVDSVCGVAHAPFGTVLLSQTAGDCTANVCDGEGNVVQQPDDKDIPADPNECTQDTCAMGFPSHEPVPQGTPCGQGMTTQCDANGNCAGCMASSDCAPSTACVTWSCSMATCVSALAVSGTPCGDAELCAYGTHTMADRCNDAGLCQDGGTQACAPYQCNGSTCGTSCAGDADCAPGHECNGQLQCVDCTSCAEWLANPTPLSSTNLCQNSEMFLTSLGACACSASCAMQCGGSVLCGDNGGIAGNCMDCVQASCGNEYVICANDY